MSEFSESYHLKSAGQDDGVALLRRAGLRGAVFTPAGEWVTVVVEGFMTATAATIAANAGTLLYYNYAEDHGCNGAVAGHIQRQVCW